MSAIIYTDGNFQGIDDNGEIIANGSLEFNNFEDGTPALTYISSDGVTPNPYSIPLSASGKADVYLRGGTYEIILKNSDGFIVRTVPKFKPNVEMYGGNRLDSREEVIATAGQTDVILNKIPLGGLQVHKNGLLMFEEEYYLTENTLIFDTALETGTKLIIEYSSKYPDDGTGTGSTDITVPDREALKSRKGEVVGEFVHQVDIGLSYTWSEELLEDNNGTIVAENGGHGFWIASYSGVVDMTWFEEEGNLLENLIALPSNMEYQRVFCTGGVVRYDGLEGEFIYSYIRRDLNDGVNTVNGWVRLQSGKKDLANLTEVAMTEELMTFSMPNDDGSLIEGIFDTFHMQGLEIVNNDTAWVVRNLQVSGSIGTGNPNEKVQIMRYPLETDGQTVSEPDFISNSFSFGHGQALSHSFNAQGELQFWGMGNTPASDSSLPEADRAVVNYDGITTYPTYPNRGRMLNHMEWLDDMLDPITNEWRLVAPFSTSNSDTWWDFGTPCVSQDGVYVCCLFADMRHFANKKLMLWKLSDIIAGNYTTVIAQKQLPYTEVSPTTEQVFQSVTIRNDRIFLQFGGYQSVDYNKRILELDMELNVIQRYDYFPSSIISTGHKVEPEGMSTAYIDGEKKLLTAYEMGTIPNATWKIFAHGTKDSQSGSVLELLPPAATVTTGGLYDYALPYSNSYRIIGYTDDKPSVTHRFLDMYLGSPRFGGGYLAFNYRKEADNSDYFDKVLYYYDLTNDRQLLQINSFGQDTTGNGAISLYGAGDTGSLAGQVAVKGTNLIPIDDNVTDLGDTNRRWVNVYATNSIIQTSDERLKTFSDIEDTEKLVAIEIKQAIKKFRWINRGDRIHFGVSAQTVGAIFTKHGLDPTDYSLFTFDEWEGQAESRDEKGVIVEPEIIKGDRYGIRYGELAMFILSAI